MEKKLISTSSVAALGDACSQAMRAGDFACCAGAIPRRADGAAGEGSFTEQARATSDNLAAVAGSLKAPVRVGFYLRDFGNFAAVNEIFAEYLTHEPPARTSLQADFPASTSRSMPGFTFPTGTEWRVL